MKIISKINWDKVNNLIPAIIQNNENNTVLMLGYMNKEALQKTISTKNVWFYSRTKKRLWMKGETSKNILHVVDIKLDCDNDALLIKAIPAGPTCHLNRNSCFNTDENQNEFQYLFNILKNRKKEPKKSSYCSKLFNDGIYKICTKIAEESGELITAITKETKQRVIEESVDLIFHIFASLVQENITLSDIENEIRLRKK